MNKEQLSKVKVAIVGGGYGGAAAALALGNLGMDVKLYEQAEGITEVGAGIGLRPSTMQFFRENNGFEAIAAVSSPSDKFRICTETGHEIHSEAWPEMNDFDVFTNTRMIHRADFIEALRNILPEGVLVLGHKLDDIVDNGNSATLHFANGETVTADLVIGADGIRSVVRNKLFSQAQPVFAKTHAYRIVIDAKDAEGMLVDGDLRLFMDQKGTMIYFLPLLHRNQVSFDITVLSDDPTWSPEITKDYLLRRLEGFDPRLVEITKNLDMSKLNCRSGYDLDSIPNWHSDSVALLGDAAHAMLWHQGQGANTAVMDAGGLAEALKQADSIKEALKLYQDIRKPVTDELQAISRQSWDPDAIETAFPGQQSQR
ncbi:MAG: FAD-dependent oxidoreductase [Micrococcales bacterium]